MSSTHASSPPKKPKRKLYTGLIWPKDTSPKPKSTSQPTPKQPHRILDILTGRGPDIFLGNTDFPKSHLPRATWSQWSHVSGVRPLKTISFLPWSFPMHSYTRRPTQLYDFAARRYKEWTPDWHPADYPCAYCCCVPWRECKHADARGPAVVLGARQRGGERWEGCCDEWLLEGSEHRCECEECRMRVWKQQHHQHDRINVADYRCDGLS